MPGDNKIGTTLDRRSLSIYIETVKLIAQGIPLYSGLKRSCNATVKAGVIH